MRNGNFARLCSKLGTGKTVRQAGIGIRMTERIYLVSCVAKKRAYSSSARNLYLSDWFVSARDRVMQEREPWYILSAKFGLLHPDKVIAPYDVTLNKLGVADRRRWAARVITQMDEALPHADEVVIFAGQRYREFLEEYLRRRYSSVKVPMEGLRIGEQLRWMKHGPA